MRKPLIERLFKKTVILECGCWEWHGAKTGDGYGQIWHDGKRNAYVHRVAYEFWVGPIPDGLTLDHLCKNRACFNPGHLELATSGENVMRGEGACAKNARKTHCPRNHEYDEENTYRPRAHPDQRACRECRRWTKEQRADWDAHHDPETGELR